MINGARQGEAARRVGWGEVRPENSPVDCFQHRTGGALGLFELVEQSFSAPPRAMQSIAQRPTLPTGRYFYMVSCYFEVSNFAAFLSLRSSLRLFGFLCLRTVEE